MDEEQRAKQRISFAYGNAAIDNPEVTRELVAKIAEQERICVEAYHAGNSKPLQQVIDDLRAKANLPTR